MNSDIIEALKNNKIAFGLMPEEMQAKLMGFWGSDNLLVYTEEGKWKTIDLYESKSPDIRATYCLQPDYQEEPEIDVKLALEAIQEIAGKVLRKLNV